MSLTIRSVSQHNNVKPEVDQRVTLRQTTAKVSAIAEEQKPFEPESEMGTMRRPVTMRSNSWEKLSIVVEKCSNFPVVKQTQKVVLSGLVTLRDIAQYPALKCLTLRNCPSFSDQDLDAITALIVNPEGELLELELEDLPMITLAGLERMRTSLQTKLSAQNSPPLSIMKITVQDSRIDKWEGRAIPSTAEASNDPSLRFYHCYRGILKLVRVNVSKSFPEPSPETLQFDSPELSPRTLGSHTPQPTQFWVDETN